MPKSTIEPAWDDIDTIIIESLKTHKEGSPLVVELPEDEAQLKLLQHRFRDLFPMTLRRFPHSWTYSHKPNSHAHTGPLPVPPPRYCIFNETITIEGLKLHYQRGMHSKNLAAFSQDKAEAHIMSALDSYDGSLNWFTGTRDLLIDCLTPLQVTMGDMLLENANITYVGEDPDLFYIPEKRQVTMQYFRELAQGNAELMVRLIGMLSKEFEGPLTLFQSAVVPHSRFKNYAPPEIPQLCIREQDILSFCESFQYDIATRNPRLAEAGKHPQTIVQDADSQKEMAWAMECYERSKQAVALRERVAASKQEAERVRVLAEESLRELDEAVESLEDFASDAEERKASGSLLSAEEKKIETLIARAAALKALAIKENDLLLALGYNPIEEVSAGISKVVNFEHLALTDIEKLGATPTEEDEASKLSAAISPEVNFEELAAAILKRRQALNALPVSEETKAVALSANFKELEEVALAAKTKAEEAEAEAEAEAVELVAEVKAADAREASNSANLTLNILGWFALSVGILVLAAGLLFTFGVFPAVLAAIGTTAAIGMSAGGGMLAVAGGAMLGTRFFESSCRLGLGPTTHSAIGTIP